MNKTNPTARNYTINRRMWNIYNEKYGRVVCAFCGKPILIGDEVASQKAYGGRRVLYCRACAPEARRI